MWEHGLNGDDRSGIHESGTLVGCLRKLEGWNFSSIITEVNGIVLFHIMVVNWIIQQYRAYAGTKARYVNEQFIELFDLDLVTLPPNLPDWLIDQQNMLASIPIVFIMIHCTHSNPQIEEMAEEGKGDSCKQSKALYC